MTTWKFECPFGDDEDCPNTITVETSGYDIDDAYGCHHVEPLTEAIIQTLYDLIDDRWQGLYDDEMDRRVDQGRDL